MKFLISRTSVFNRNAPPLLLDGIVVTYEADLECTVCGNIQAKGYFTVEISSLEKLLFLLRGIQKNEGDTDLIIKKSLPNNKDIAYTLEIYDTYRE